MNECSATIFIETRCTMCILPIKRPDGTTLLPWARGKPMAWDVTVPDTYAEWHIDQTAREACSAANKAAASKIVKYGTLSASHIFLPVAVEPPAPGTSPP